MDALTTLLKIPAFGRQLFNGSYYSVKFRVPEAHKENIVKLGRKYPEMKMYHATTGFIIFGGTFPQRSEFMNDCKRLLTPKKHVAKS